MNKKLSILLIALIILNAGFSSTAACSYSPTNYVWHCSNNSPGVSITPGSEGELTFYCCYTGPGLNDTDEYNLHIEKLFNYTRSVQQQNGSYLIEFTDYVASDFITSIDYPQVVNPNIDIPITVHFSMPDYDENYAPSTAIRARTDVMLNTGGAFILNNAVIIRVVIPAEWEAPLLIRIRDFILNNAILCAGVLLIAIIAILAFYYRKKKK